jgi:hypothetical protein
MVCLNILTTQGGKHHADNFAQQLLLCLQAAFDLGH